MTFADTSFWIALFRRRERHHDIASTLWSARPTPVVLTNHVLGEIWTFLRRREDHEIAGRAVRAIRRSDRVDVVHVEQDVEDEAWRWLARHDERAYSFVDATSFAVMRRLGMQDAYAFDGDFSAAGFVELRP